MRNFVQAGNELYTNNIYDFVLKDNFVYGNIYYKDLLYNKFNLLYNKLNILLKNYEGRIVFGIKKGIDLKLTTEFYFYNNNSAFSIVDYKEIYNIGKLPLMLKEHFMFSFEYNIFLKIDSFDFYLPDGNSYRFNGNNIEYRNKYNFFGLEDIKKGYKLLLEYTEKDLFIFKYLSYFEVFLVKTGSICISKKKNGIGIYLNRINYSGFICFLYLFDYDYDIKKFFMNKKFIGINFDIGLDFTKKSGNFILIKKSFYGVI